MNVTSFQVQRVLRTYGRQLNRNRQFLQHQPKPDPQQTDSVTISTKARRLQVLESIATNLVRNMGRQETSQEVESEALARLSQEYGETLAIVGAEEDNLGFAVVDPNDHLMQSRLSREESEKLQTKLAAIILEIIDRNMIGRQEMI
jgi:hypothetical protein